MKVIWNGKTIAEAERKDVIYIEGNWYFPPKSVKKEFLHKSDTPYTCPWRGVCQYYHIGESNDEKTWSRDSAMTYPNPKPSAIDTVKKDFANYFAFWQNVTVEK